MTNPFGSDQAIDDLGQYIKSQREIAKITARHLARAAEISDQQLQLIEQGRSRPPADILANIAKGLGLPSDALLRFMGSSTPPTTESPVITAIKKDKKLNDAQRSALIQTYKSMVGED